MSRYKHAIVVGASSGIGQAIALQLAEDGCRVAVLARRKDRLDKLRDAHPESVLPFEHDVTRYDEVPALFQEVTKQLGGLDLIVYASGVMPSVAIDEYDFEKDRRMVEVNLLGAVAWLNQAAARFEHTRHGTSLALGSVAGDRGRLRQPVYNASKAGLHTYLEALRNRLCRLGVKVVTVKPGPVRTEMTEHLSFRSALSPEQAAAIILRKAKRSGEHYLLPQHRLFFFDVRNIPSWIFRRLNL